MIIISINRKYTICSWLRWLCFCQMHFAQAQNDYIIHFVNKTGLQDSAFTFYVTTPATGKQGGELDFSHQLLLV